jgi:hypothetical protein
MGDRDVKRYKQVKGRQPLQQINKLIRIVREIALPNEARAIDQDQGKAVVDETPSKPEHIHLIFSWLVPYHQGPRDLINPCLPIL